jgi:hypothetical protein
MASLLKKTQLQKRFASSGVVFPEWYTDQASRLGVGWVHASRGGSKELWHFL